MTQSLTFVFEKYPLPPSVASYGVGLRYGLVGIEEPVEPAPVVEEAPVEEAPVDVPVEPAPEAPAEGVEDPAPEAPADGDVPPPSV